MIKDRADSYHAIEQRSADDAFTSNTLGSKMLRKISDIRSIAYNGDSLGECVYRLRPSKFIANIVLFYREKKRNINYGTFCRSYFYLQFVRSFTGFSGWMWSLIMNSE